jgi:hypothetical protein
MNKDWDFHGGVIWKTYGNPTGTHLEKKGYNSEKRNANV